MSLQPLPLLLAVLALTQPGTTLAQSRCTLPDSLHGRQMTNVSDPLYQTDNPNAGRVVIVNFAADHYQLRVAATGLRVQGQYRYHLLQPHIAEISMVEQFPGGTSRYRLLLTCLNAHAGRIIFTQDEGPILPAQRQNGGTWAFTD